MAKSCVTGWTGMAATLALGAVLALAVPAHADVKDGVDAWSRGDYAAAIAQWREPAAQGDPDAQFNMGQAYRLGLGVDADPQRARDYYYRAAQRGHLRAADTYGLILFQEGRHAEALPYVRDAARRGDPRSQYLLGIAHFNGENVERDWVRAYALLTLANGQGLPQAVPVIADMDQHIPLDQRQQAAALALELQQEAEAARARELASADLDMFAASAGPAQAAAPPSTAPLPSASPRVPAPIASTEIPPSTAYVSPDVAAARAAVREAAIATGTESPADAGADYARPASPTPQIAVAQPPAARPAAPPAPVAAAQPAPAASGPWKLQLGAFGVAGNAEKLWDRLSGRPELAGKKRLLVPAGRLTKLQAGGYATRGAAAEACERLQRSGQACIVTR